MRIPKNVPLATYIRQLLRTGKIVQFYKSEDWNELRRDVLEEFHNECAECLKRGAYTPADCVHHVNEVKVRPDLALSKFYTDTDGKKKRQLVPLCNKCHNLVHEKLKKWQNENKFTNEERW